MTRPTTTGKAQDLITFTRSTTGTALAKISYGEELVTNGTFDNDAVGATPSTWETNNANASLIKQSDGTALFSSASFAYARVANADRPIIPAGVYKVSFSISDTSGSLSNVHVGVGTGGNTINGDGDYQYLFTSTSEQAYELQIRPNGGGTGAFKIDNISVKEVLYDQPDGTLQLFNHPIDKPRIEYDASGNCLGLLVEEARTNLVTYSNELLSASWSGAALNVVSSIPSIAGGQCFRLSSGNPVSNYWIQTEVASNGQTKSIWARTVSGTGTAHILGHNSVAATLVTLTEQWQRFSLPVNTSEIGGDHFYAVDFRGSGTLSEILVFGAQVEAGSFPTSYIPTSGSAVTRSSDVASLAVSEFGYNQDQGSVVVDFIPTDHPSSTYNQLIVSDGASKRWVYFNDTATYSVAGFDGTNQIAITNVLAPIKAAIGLSSTQGSIAANGDASANSTDVAHNGNILTSTSFDIAANTTAHIKSVQYYPLRLSNAQLQALTV